MEKTGIIQKDTFDLTPYLGGQKYDYEILIKKARSNIGLMVEGMVEAGNCLICIKKMEGHGNFLNALEQIGISSQRASELMSIAYCYENKLLSNITPEKMKTWGKKKLLLLAKLPDEIIKEFSKDEIPGGIQIDEIDTMTVQELRNRIRKVTRDYENGKKQYDNLKAKLDEDMEQDMEEYGDIKKWQGRIIDGLSRINKILKERDNKLLDRMKAEDFEGLNARISPIRELIMGLQTQVLNLCEDMGIE